MATDRQMAANFWNALKSTGPKTVAGKVRASLNSFKHGAYARLDTWHREIMLRAGEDPHPARPGCRDPARGVLGPAVRRRRHPVPLRKSPVRTAAMLAANRTNAQKCTGPNTREGKARAALNALKHGRRAVRLRENLLQAGECQSEAL